MISDQKAVIEESSIERCRIEHIQAICTDQLTSMEQQCKKLQEQRRLDKEFIETQLVEREQENEEFRSKLHELTARETKNLLDQNALSVQKVNILFLPG